MLIVLRERTQLRQNKWGSHGKCLYGEDHEEYVQIYHVVYGAAFKAFLQLNLAAPWQEGETPLQTTSFKKCYMLCFPCLLLQRLLTFVTRCFTNRRTSSVASGPRTFNSISTCSATRFTSRHVSVLLPDSQRALALPGENDGDPFELRDVAADPVVEDGLQEAAGESSGGHLRRPAAAAARSGAAAPSSSSSSSTSSWENTHWSKHVIIVFSLMSAQYYRRQSNCFLRRYHRS